MIHGQQQESENPELSRPVQFKQLQQLVYVVFVLQWQVSMIGVYSARL
jgi:hypothetical protein